MNHIIETDPTFSPKQPVLKFAPFIIEILLIVLAGIFAASIFADFNPQMRVGGDEMEYLTRTAYTLGTIVPEKGYLPLWDPYMEYGDPMLENPVSFAFNPFLTWPSIVFGPQNGIKLSIILTAIIAGLGGWVLARVLRLGTLARLLLAMLCIGNGNMYSFLSQGHFALFAVQAYFPWIFAGVIGILQGYRRWPIVLTALAFALVFWTGLPWYPPAIVLTTGILTLIWVIEIRRTETASRFRYAVRVGWRKLALVALSMLLTLCLAAITFLPLWATKDYIGSSSLASDFQPNLGVVIAQFFSGYKEIDYTPIFPAGNTSAFYSYISPLWYVLLIVVLLCVIGFLRRSIPKMPWRIFIASSAIFIFCLLWGAGQNPFIEWSYQAIPLAAQFRHVERVLGLAAMWMAVIIALCVDTIWSYLVRNPISIHENRLSKFISTRKLRIVLAAGFTVLTGLASFQVVGAWHETWGTDFVRPEDQWEDYCVSWLRQQYPDQQLSVWTLLYKNIYTYYRNDVRHGWVASDFYHAKPIPSTIYSGSLVTYEGDPRFTLPEFALGPPHYDESWLQDYGYKPIPESADPYRNNIPCLYRRDGAYSYAFWVTRTNLYNNPHSLPSAVTNPITTFVRDYDRIGVLAKSKTDEDVVVTVQELAFPGWQVQIDDKHAHLEFVGGQIGVVLPRDGEDHIVLFRYLPPVFFQGSAITLLTIAVCTLFLLRADRILTVNVGHDDGT